MKIKLSDVIAHLQDTIAKHGNIEICAMKLEHQNGGWHMDIGLPVEVERINVTIGVNAAQQEGN